MKQLNFNDGDDYAPDLDFECRRCGVMVLPDEVCQHENCRDCQKICCKDSATKFCSDPNCTCRMSAKNFRPAVIQGEARAL